MRHEPLVLAVALVLTAAPVRAQEAGSRAAEPHPSPGAVDTTLAPGARIRMKGDAVDDLGRPTGREILTFGLAGAYLFHRDAEGTVLFADGDSLVFSDRKRGDVISLDWERLESIEVHRGRDIAGGALEGAAWGAVGGLITWGMMELAFNALDLGDADGAMIMAASTVGGVIGGAMSLGDRWEPVRPPRR